MRKTLLCLAFLASSVLTAPAVTYIVNGELAASDHLTTDSTTKTFYYDVYEILNPTAASMFVTLTIEAGANLRPWAAYWLSPVLPAPDWESPTDLYSAAADTLFSTTPGDTLNFSAFALAPGASIQLAVATQNYNEDGALLDSYTLTVDAGTVTITSIPVPEPGVLALLALFPLLGWRRMRRI